MSHRDSEVAVGARRAVDATGPYDPYSPRLDLDTWQSGVRRPQPTPVFYPFLGSRDEIVAATLEVGEPPLRVCRLLIEPSNRGV
jgi:hypothetical protein